MNKLILTTSRFRFFSTSNHFLYPLPQSNIPKGNNPEGNNSDSNLTIEQKQIITDAVKNYDKTHNKPEFQHPGYPDFDSLAERCTTRGQYDLALDKLKESCSIQPQMREYLEKRSVKVSNTVAAQNPSIPLQKVKDVVNEEGAKEYASEPDEDNTGTYYTKKGGQFQRKNKLSCFRARRRFRKYGQ